MKDLKPPATVSTTRTRRGHKDDIAANGFIRLAPRTHDSSHAGEHIPNIEYLAEDLEAAVQAVWPRRHEFRYANVQVLLISWEADDLGVMKEIFELRDVLDDLYHYDVQMYRIPNIKPDKALKGRMLKFLEQDGEDTLLILYYAGHARSAPSNEAPVWCASRKPNSPFLKSGGIQSLMEEADSDALLLYDCCNAAAMTSSDSRIDQAGITEVIAACGYEAVAAEVGEHSFTTALMEILATGSKGVPFSIGELHNRILNRLKCWAPSVMKDKNGKMKENDRGGMEYERQPRRTPIYSILCESKPRRSILLAPLSKHQAPLEALGLSTGQVNEERKKDLKRKRSLSPEEESKKCSQVIISVQLLGDNLDIPAWRECIRLFPAEAQEVKIEGIYESFSTLLLVRMPVAVWNLLPQNSAYSFVGYVTSENHAAKLQALAGPQEVQEKGTSKLIETTGETDSSLKCILCRLSRQKCVPDDISLTERTWIEGGQQDKCARCVRHGYSCGPPFDPQRRRAPPASEFQDWKSGDAIAETTDVQPPLVSTLRRSVEVEDELANFSATYGKEFNTMAGLSQNPIANPNPNPPRLERDQYSYYPYSNPFTYNPYSFESANLYNQNPWPATTTGYLGQPLNSSQPAGQSSLERMGSVGSVGSLMSPMATRPSSPQPWSQAGFLQNSNGFAPPYEPLLYDPASYYNPMSNRPTPYAPSPYEPASNYSNNPFFPDARPLVLDAPNPPLLPQIQRATTEVGAKAPSLEEKEVPSSPDGGVPEGSKRRETVEARRVVKKRRVRRAARKT